jgi:hypothetical protein
MYGPPVRPPQPKSGLNAAFGGSLDWEASAGEDRYRRGIYTLWRRTNPYPSFMAMDATDRKTCTIRRIRTNTPVAAFVTLNDPAFVDAAQQLARMIGNKSDRSLEDKIRWVFYRVVCRKPSPQETDELRKLCESVSKKYSADAESARQMAGGGNPQDNPAELAAWTVVCNVLLNLDEVLTKN